MKIGILGGTFDPIHRAHLQLGREAARTFGLAKVLVMPTGVSYLKTNVGRRVSSPQIRAEMVKRAVSGEPDLVFSDLELRRPGNTYTADTLRILTEKVPEAEWYFIVGADSLHELPTWHDPEAICHRADLLVALRRGQVERSRLEEDCRFLRERYGARIHILDWEGMDLSSSQIREDIARGCCPHPALTPAVNDWIARKGLYLSPLDEEEITRRLQGELSPQRWRHTCGVAQTAQDLASWYGTVSPGRARLAGLLHDCGKNRGTALTHGPIGAKIAREEYGICDEELLDAIRFHTVGRPAMTDLEKMVFIADYIEPNRDRAPHLRELRELAFIDMDKTIRRILEDTLAYLRDSGKDIDESSLKTYTYYKNRTQ